MIDNEHCRDCQNVVGFSRGAFQIYIKLPLVIRDSVVVDLVGKAELLHRFGPRS